VFGIGWTEFVVIALVLLIFVGPKQLPALLQKVGQVIGELKSASRDLRSQVADEVRDFQNDIGDITSPKKIVKDMVHDLTYDVRSPYEEAKRAEADLKGEISDLKNEFRNLAKEPAKKESEVAADLEKVPSVETSSSKETT